MTFTIAGPPQGLDQPVAQPGEGKDGKAAPEHKEQRKDNGPQHAAEKIAPPAKAIGQPAAGKLADGVGQHSQRSDRPQPDLGDACRDPFAHLLGKDER